MFENEKILIENEMILIENERISLKNESILIESIENFDEKIMKNVKNLGLTASASAPEVLVQNFIKLLKKKFTVIVNEPPYITENVIFKIEF